MDKLKLIRRINNAIAELQNIREELTSEYPEIYHDMTMWQLLDGKASVRLLNVMKHDEVGNISVVTFVQNFKHTDMLKYRGFGKLTMLELSRIIKEETGIDW